MITRIPEQRYCRFSSGYSRQNFGKFCIGADPGEAGVLVLLIHTIKGVLEEAEIYPFGAQKLLVLSCSTTHFWSNVTTLVGALESVATPIFLTTRIDLNLVLLLTFKMLGA